MSVTSTVTSAIAGGQAQSYSKSYTGDTRTSMSFSVADSVTDEQRTVAIDITELQLFYMVSDQDVTVDWNDAAGTQDTVNLKANVPWIERLAADQYQATKFAVDVTNFFITNASGATANIRIEVVQNNTP